MSKGTNLSGRTLVVDEVVQLTKEEEGGLDTFAMQLEGEAQKLTKAQVEYKNTYSISVSGDFELTTNKDAQITVNVYRNGVKALPSDSVVFGSKVSYVSQNGKYNSNGEYASHYKRTIKIDEINAQSETILCIWKGNSDNAVPITTSFTLTVGSINQYAYSKYTDEEKVKEQPLVWYDTIEGAKTVVSNDLRYLWMRQSSIYDFTKKEYIDWKYYKTDIEYEGRTKDDTADDTINTIVPAKFINFLFSKQTYTVNRRSTDADLITFSYSFTGYKNVAVTTPWTVSGFTLTDEQKTASSITISVPHNNTFSSIVVSVTVTCDEKEFPWTMILTPIDITEPERYAGVLESIPQGDTLPDGSKAINGDWFVLKSTNIMYVLDMSYVGDTAPWKPYDNSNALSTIPLEKVSTALVDMINLGTTDKTTATLLGVFKALCADQGFVKYLQTYSLTIGKGNFKVEIQDHNPTTGEELANPIFKVSYGGNTVFQIDASTGNVFIGKPNSNLTAPETGFMYDAVNQDFKCKNENFKVDREGRVYGFFQQVTQFMPFNFEDSLDSEHPMECNFYIPNNAIIQKISLSIKSLKYRTYSAGTVVEKESFFSNKTAETSFSGKLDVDITTTTLGAYYNVNTKKSGSHKHSFNSPNAFKMPFSDNATTSDSSYSASLPQHKHGYKLPTGFEYSADTTEEAGDHSHEITLPSNIVTGVAGSANISVLNHSHSFSFPHSHRIKLGIIEGDLPTDIKLSCNNSGNYGNPISLGTFDFLSDSDITNSFSGTGWKSIKLTSASLGRLVVQLFVEMRVNTEISS